MELTEKNEQEIIRAVISGNHQAFEWIVKNYKDTVASICINMLKDRNLAEEVGQDTFIRLYNSLPSFRFESSLKTFVSRIAVNLSLNKIKQQKTWWNRFVGGDELLSNHVVIQNNADDRLADKELLQIGLQKLDEKHRILVVLRVVEGYSVKETAEILNIKHGTVMSGLSRALDKLKVILKTLGYEHE